MMMDDAMCDELLSGLDIDTKRYLVLVITELNASRQKHKVMGIDYVHAAAVVSEEAGELVRAALLVTYENGRYYEMHKEAVQVSAMGLRFLLDAAPELPFPENTEHPAHKRLVQARKAAKS